MKLKGKAAIVTGSRRNIGRAIALAIAEEGGDVVLLDKVGLDELKQAAQEISALGARALPLLADITDAAAVKFANEQIRVAANDLAQAYYRARRIVDQWFALSMSAAITNTADEIIDGSQTDGRPVITGAKATNVITRLSEFCSDYEANSNAKLNTVLAVAPQPGGSTPD